MLVIRSMDRFDEILSELKIVTPPDGLDERVIGAVRQVRRRRKFMVATLWAAMLLTAPVLVASFRLLVSDISASSLTPLLNLGITDWQSVRSSLDAWIMAVFEALPVGSLALTLGASFLLILLINKIMSNSCIRNKNMKEAI